MTVSDRLRMYCEKNGITQKSLIDKGLGTSQTINNYWHGHTEPKAGFLEMFIKEFRLSAKWLMTGEDDTPIKEYHNQESINLTSEAKTTFYTCMDCIEKEKKILDLRGNINDLRKHVELLEFSLGKFRKNGSE